MYICFKNNKLKVSWKVIAVINTNFQDPDVGNCSGSAGENINLRANSCSLNQLIVNIALLRRHMDAITFQDNLFGVLWTEGIV